jgi:hypothetical protein
LAVDSASEVILEEVVGFSAGLARLRDDVFDAVLVGHEPGELDALALAEALRTAGCEEPLIVLGEQNEAEMTTLCLEANADAYLCVHATTTRTLMWVVSRAIERHYLLRENRRLQQADQHRLDLEQGDAVRLLADEWALVRELDAIIAGGSHENDPASLDAGQSFACRREPLTSADCAGTAGEGAELHPRPVLPPELESHYRELVRAYVMMGSGNLATEMHALAQLLAAARISAGQTIQLHIHALESLLQGLGSRSARHVMNRGNLLALEIVAHLCEAYRRPSSEVGATYREA